MEVTSLYNFCSEDNGGVGWSRVKGGGRRNATTPMASRSGKGEDYATCICICGGGGGGGGGGESGNINNRNSIHIDQVDFEQHTCGDCNCNGKKTKRGK